MKTKTSLSGLGGSFLLSLACILSAGAAALSPAPKPAARPNIIFFIVDDMEADLFNYRPEGKGKNLTPHLDRLVSEGTVFRNQQIPSSVCTPSRFSCLTGRYANRSRDTRQDPLCRAAGMNLVSWTATIDPEMPTLPRMLQAAGYRTGLAGKCHFTTASGRGKIEVNADPNDAAVKRTLRENYQLCVEAVRRLGFDEVGSLFFGGQVQEHRPEILQQHNMDWIAKGGLDFLNQRKGDARPFCLYFATTLPHTPHDDAKSWNADPRVTPAGMLKQPCRVLPDRRHIPERLKAAGLPFDSRRAMAVAVDDALGALLKKLKEIGRLDNTVIFFFNDNGQEGKGTVYEGGITSPSVVWRQGGFAAGRETEALVSNIDFAPTIVEWAGITVKPGTFDGASLVPLLEGRVQTIRDSAYAEMGFTRAVRQGNWKYVAFRLPPNARNLPEVYYPMTSDPTAGKRPTFGHMAVRPYDSENATALLAMRESVVARHPGYWDADQLYDLSSDPNEQHNLAADPAHAAKLDEMKAKLKQEIRDIPGSFGDLKPDKVTQASMK